MAQVFKWADKDFKATTIVILKDLKEIIVTSEQMGNQDRTWNTRKKFKRKQTDTPELEFQLKIWNEKFTGWP